MPHTLLIAPGGKVIYRKSGEIDMSEILSKLIDTLGAYYTTAEK